MNSLESEPGLIIHSLNAAFTFNIIKFNFNVFALLKW